MSSGPNFLIVGRSPECDVVLEDPTVSGRHTRLSWEGSQVLVEDLASANGTFVRGQRVVRVLVRVGEDVRIGGTPLPWSDPGLRRFLRRGALGDTAEGLRIPGRRFICGACGARGIMPESFVRGSLTCDACGTRLEVGLGRARAWMKAGLLAVALLAAFATGSVLYGMFEPGARGGPGVAEAAVIDAGSASSPQEASIRQHVVTQVVAAIDATHPLTRNTAVKLAAEDEGAFRIEQVARLWSHVRGRWRYVNDPRGTEYFARASETIENGWVGDCDDFATVLAAMITAIGGEARIVMMDGPRGGHAYAEVCVTDPPEEVRKRLAHHYKRNWDRYLGRQKVESIHFRVSESCPVWLNLDWYAGVPGGDYDAEAWAVAIYPDGQTETLAPSPGPVDAETAERMRMSSPPRD